METGDPGLVGRWPHLGELVPLVNDIQATAGLGIQATSTKAGTGTWRYPVGRRCHRGPGGQRVAVRSPVKWLDFWVANPGPPPVPQGRQYCLPTRPGLQRDPDLGGLYPAFGLLHRTGTGAGMMFYGYLALVTRQWPRQWHGCESRIDHERQCDHPHDTGITLQGGYYVFQHGIMAIQIAP